MSIDLMDYRDGDTLLQAGVARPTSAERVPAVLVVHQWAGRGDAEHETAERLAALGYIGVAVDIFGKGIEGDPVGDNTPLIAPWLGNRAGLARRIGAAVDFVHGLEGVDVGKIAAIGYCFGGLVVLDLARTGRRDVQGVVSMHGLLDGNGLAADGPITAKVLVHHGWRDPLATPDKVLSFSEEMLSRKADWQLHAHGQAMHAFTNPGAQAPDIGMLYNPEGDRRSWASVVDFLEEVFKNAV